MFSGLSANHLLQDKLMNQVEKRSGCGWESLYQTSVTFRKLVSFRKLVCFGKLGIHIIKEKGT